MVWGIVACIVVLVAIFAFSRIFPPNNNQPSTERIEFKPIPGKKPQGDIIWSFKTKVVGVTFDNLDGSNRQAAIRQLRPGDRLQLAWYPKSPHDQNAIMVFGKGSMSQLDMSTCIGHLKADLAADVVEWLDDDSITGIYAAVDEVLGGTSDKPTYGCLIEIITY